MPISEATIKSVKFPPELLPDSWFGNVPANAEVAPPVLDLRRLKPFIITLTNIQTTQPAGFARVNLRARYDAARIEENVAALLPALVGAWQLLAKDNLFLNFFNTGAIVNDYSTHYGVWAYPPTVAHKLFYGITLTNEEQALAKKYGIYDGVEKGVFPLPISQQIEREYHIMGEETHSRSVNIAVANTRYTLESIYPKTNEIVVLTRIAAAPGAVGQVVRLVVDRDGDSDYADVRTFPLSLAAGGEVECFIPALKEIRLTAEAAVAPPPHLFRYTFRRIRISNTLRARFGLASKEELPGDVWEKCVAGVL